MRLGVIARCLAIVALTYSASAQSTDYILDNSNPVVTSSRTIPWERIPEAARLALRAQTGTASLSRVQQATINGQPVYIASFQRNGNVEQMAVLADGSFFTGQNTVAWSLVPTAVQNNFEEQSDLGAINNISEQTTAGRKIYVFTVQEGTAIQQLQFDADGTYLGPITQQTTPVSAEAVPWNQLPPAVQSTATIQAGTARVTGATSAVMNGQPVYEITAVEPGGEQATFRVATDGTVVGRAIITEAAGAARTRPAGLSLTELPPSVQSTVKSYSGIAQIQSIQPQFVNGKLCYEVSLEQNGITSTMCVSEDGGIAK